VSRQWTSPALDGDIYTQPLLAGGRVVVATEGDTVYSLDPASGRIQWSTSLGRPVDGSTLPCGDIDPSGITSTPVIDSTTGLVWVVDFVQPDHHDLVSLDLSTGQIRSRRPVDPPGVSPDVEQQRGALTLANGQVYVPFGGLYGDCGAYHGFVVGAPVAGGALASWQAPTAREGGVWASPGAAVDSGGRLFVTTGNGSSTSVYDEGNAVVRLSPALVQEDQFAPTNWAQLSRTDTDLGSVAPTLLPDGGVFQVGKQGVGYLLDGNHLGGIGGQRAQAPVCQSAFGGTAVSGTTIFVPCRDGLVAVTVTGSRIAVVWQGPTNPAGTPVLSGGLVWELCADGALFGLDPQTGAVRFRDHVTTATHFPAIAAGQGQLFVPAGSRVLAYRGV
jgi:outer membrane protein assembly factor BamB